MKKRLKRRRKITATIVIREFARDDVALVEVSALGPDGADLCRCVAPITRRSDAVWRVRAEAIERGWEIVTAGGSQ